jgi:ribosomal protein S18 acetylase RimI-like enzyme
VTRAPIRPAGPGDAPALAQARFAFRAEVETPAEDESAFHRRCTAWMAARLTADGYWRAWIAERARHPVGCVWLQLVEKLPNPVAEPEWHGYVSSLYVEASERSGGLGSALLAECLAECARRAVDAVVLWPTPRSRTLYLRHGFAVRDDLLQLRGPGPTLSG